MRPEKSADDIKAELSFLSIDALENIGILHHFAMT